MQEIKKDKEFEFFDSEWSSELGQCWCRKLWCGYPLCEKRNTCLQANSAQCINVVCCESVWKISIFTFISHPPLTANWHAWLKLKPLFIKNNRLLLLSLFFSSLLYLSTPPHWLLMVYGLTSPLGTRKRFALITELLFTPAEKGKKGALQTPTLAHCSAPSAVFQARLDDHLCVY